MTKKRTMACEPIQSQLLLIGTCQRIPRLLKRFATWSTIPEAPTARCARAQSRAPNSSSLGKLPEPRPENWSKAETFTIYTINIEVKALPPCQKYKRSTSRSVNLQLHGLVQIALVLTGWHEISIITALNVQGSFRNSKQAEQQIKRWLAWNKYC